MTSSAPSIAPPPAWWGRVIGGVAMAALLVFPLVSDDVYIQNMIILTLVLAIGAAGLNVISGLAGYVSFGHGVFIGIGGYTMGVLGTRFTDLPIWLWVPMAGVAAGLAALLLGFVALRSRGDTFVIITVAFLFLVQVLATELDSLTGGAGGHTLPLPTWDLEFLAWPFYYVLTLLLVLQLLMTWWIKRTKFGMALVAIREDESKAATVGVRVPAQKLLAFVCSAVIVGMAGAVYGYYLTFIDPRGMFGIFMSIQIVLALLIGGRGTLWGPVVGAFILEPLNQLTNDIGGGNPRLILMGAALILLVLVMPQGLLPAFTTLLGRIRMRGKPGMAGARIDTDTPFPATVLSTAPTAPRPSSSDLLLDVRGVSKRFGGLKALNECTLTVSRGSITALIGPNGSGKTTAFNVLDGTEVADEGTIFFDGQRMDGLPSWERAHLGLGRTFQTTRLFPAMSVLENVVVAQRGFAWSELGRVAVRGREAAAAAEVLDYVGVGAYAQLPAHALSYGQQKMVELAQILMLKPTLVLLDEPAGGINPVLVERVGQMIREINAHGTTFLIVEHDMTFVLELSDYVHVLSGGSVMSSGTPEQIKNDPAVIDAYLGDDFAPTAPEATDA